MKRSKLVTRFMPPYRRGAAFVPTDIGGLELWLRSDLGVTKDGANLVSQWADQSGNGYNATQAVDANKFTWIGSVINGLPGLQGNGTTSFMTIDGAASIFDGADTSLALFIVFQGQGGTDAAYYGLFCWGSLDWTNALYFYRRRVNDSPWVFSYAAGGVDKNTTYVMPDADFNPAAWNNTLLEVKHSGGLRNVWYNNTQIVTDADADAGVLDCTTVDIGRLAMADRTWLQYYSTDKYVEILAYTPAPSAADRLLIRNYLNTRYAIY